MGIGDWGLGIGDWAQSPIPNPQSPFFILYYLILFIFIIFKLFCIFDFNYNLIINFIIEMKR